MKPVELEIFLQDGVTPGLKSAGAAVGRFSDDAKAELKEVTESLKLQKQHVSRLSQELKSLEKAYKSATPGNEKMALGQRLASMRKELEDERAAVTQLTQMQDELKRKQEEGGTSLRMQLRTLREEIATLLLAYRSLTDAEKNTAQGRELARHIDELTEKAGELNDAIMDTSQAVTNAASDTRGFDQLAGGMQLVVDGFGLATAGAQALGLSEEDLIEVQTRLQTALVASNALTSMQTNLQKQSAVMQGIAAIQAKSAATAENIKTWAVGRGVVATKAATVAQAAFNAVAKANPYVLLAAAVVTVVGALWAFSKGSKEAKKAEEERQAKLEKAKQEQESYRQAVVDAAGEQISSFIRLKKAWDDLGDSLDKKKKFVADTKDEWRKLGREISTVNDMERIFRDHTKDMLNAIIIRAELKAYETRIQAVADEMVDEIERNKTFTYKTVSAGKAIDGWYAGYGSSASGGQWQAEDITPEERAAVSGHTYHKSSKWGGASTHIDEEGARIINEMRRAAGNTAALGRQEAARQDAQERIGGYVDEMTALNNQLDTLLDKLPGTTVDPDPDPDPNPDPHKDNRLEYETRVNEELRRLRWQNEQDEINQMAEGSERRIRQIALDYEKEMAEVEKQRKDFAAANAELGTGGLNDNGLTEEQQAQIDRAAAVAENNRKNSLTDMYREEAQHMVDYLKEYGTFHQQRLAIAEEYDRKIVAASDEWTRKSLEKEKAAALQKIDIQAIKQSIDWGSVFGDFGTMFKSELEPTIEKLKAITKTEEFKNTDLQDQQTLYELISKLEEANTSWDGKIFKTLGDDLTAYQTAMRQYIAAQEAERTATEKLTEAKRRLAEAEQSGDANAIDSAKNDVLAATDNLNTASESVRDFGSKVQETSGSLQTTVTRMNNMFSGLVSGLTGLRSGNLQGVGTALMGLDKLFNNSAVTGAVGGALSKGLSKLLGNSEIGKSVASALGDSGLLGQLISAFLSILDILKDGIGVLVSDLIDTVLGAVAGILKNLLNGQMFIQIGKSLMDGISGIFDAVTFGGFSSWISSSNAKEVQETIDRLTERNATLQTAIEDLTDEIKASKGTKSVAAYRDAYKYQQETNANYLGMAKSQAGYHGAHHSWNYYFDGFSKEQIARLSQQIGREWDGSLWSLSPAEMKTLRSNVDMWEAIKNAGKGNYGGRVAEKLNDYIAQAGKLEELTTQLYEGLTGITFDSMYDSFIDQLMDMDASAEDFADNISEYFMRAMLSNKIGELYADKLEEWWKKFGKAMEDNDLTEAERKALADEYMKYVDEAIKIRDGLAAATGYDKTENGSSQSGKAGSFNAMSQDQGTKLEGLFVSAQGHLSNIDMATEDVASKLSRAESLLQKIADNTGASAETLKELKAVVEKMIRDGVRSR
nr:MAG TPA: Tape measure domain protein [Caudoviricetes sp.]